MPLFLSLKNSIASENMEFELEGLTSKVFLIRSWIHMIFLYVFNNI